MGEDTALHVPADRGQPLNGLRMADSYDVLLDDRALVEGWGDVVSGGPAGRDSSA